MRAIGSVAPPGGYGTTSVIGRLGYACASAAEAARASALATNVVRNFMGVSW